MLPIFASQGVPQRALTNPRPNKLQHTTATLEQRAPPTHKHVASIHTDAEAEAEAPAPATTTADSSAGMPPQPAR